ncbi:helix-turn-helix domain-containing protein [Mucilaginibacter paludis]|uniref:Transcriptional regulator, AraC family n=1 Tax=Mucilaginibacter paludis DSM 18603 TaxID=714943 RepID=H1Y9Z5_9SPHI|nr:helix-turn-helix domain-containing protein [Mucilaginibacter paludis]EHQ24979.1 transcriptional regulator, AraC family [Mucilaginibacter paludis DSM 18603]
MHFEFGLRSSLLLIFFTHLIVYAILSWKRGITEGRLSDQLLGAFLLSSALFIFPWMSGFAGWYDTQPYREILFYTPFIHALFFGPLLYLYLKSLTNTGYQIKKNDYYHFIPGVLYMLWSIIVVVVDKLWIGHYYLMNGRTDPDFDKWYSITWSVSILAYLALSIRYYLQYRIFTYLEFSFADVAGFKWLRNFLYAFTLLTALLVSEQILSFFIQLEYVRSWYYFFAFAIITYYMAISAYHANPVKGLKLNFEPDLLLHYQQPLRLEMQTPTTIDIAYTAVDTVAPDNEWMNSWKEKLTNMIATERVYIEPELTITELAKKMGTNASLLSKVINTCFEMSFNDLINKCRVEEAIRLMGDARYKNLNLLAIAFDAGFNSKSTFNRAFKKITGKNPKDYQAGDVV